MKIFQETDGDNMSKLKKTNAVRILEGKKIFYKAYSYKTEDGFNDGISVASKIFKDIDLVYKTLVTEGNSREIYVFVVPVASELDLKKAAAAAGEKKIDMLPVKRIFDLTGYIRGGCSPVGMKKPYKTFIDSSVNNVETVIVSGGKIGLQIELSPEDLVKTVKAEIKDVVKSGS